MPLPTGPGDLRTRIRRFFRSPDVPLAMRLMLIVAADAGLNDAECAAIMEMPVDQFRQRHGEAMRAVRDFVASS